MADYSRYSGQHISTSLTLAQGRHPGKVLMTKVLQYMRPKCHALLLDTTINSPTTVRVNIYQARIEYEGRYLLHVGI
jgi:telomerase reverse transcriptase